MILLLPPLVAADEFSFQAPEELQFTQGVWLVGNIDLTTNVTNPVYVDPERMDAQGTLTVCPVDFRTGTIPTVLESLGTDCLSGQAFTNAVIRFSPRIHLLGAGEHELERSPAASMLTAGSAGYAGWALSDDGVRLSDGAFRFASASAESLIRVSAEDGKGEFNGTEWAFIYETDSLFVQAGAIGFLHSDQMGIRMGPAPNIEQLRGALHPYLMLEIQELTAGADAREPRVNVSRVFKEFGRVPEYVNGAFLGFLNGTAANKTYHASGPSLIRGENFVGQLNAYGFFGTYDESLSLSPKGVAFDGHGVSDPPWGWIATLLVIAAVIAFIRRHPLRNGWKVKSGLLAGALLGLLVIDQSIMLGRTGASAVDLASKDAALGAIFALLVFQLVLLAGAWAFLLMPARFSVMKFVPGKHQWWAQLPLLGLWLLLVWLLPGPLFALAYEFARL